MIQRILTALLGLALFVVAFFVTSVLLAFVLTAVLLAATVLWWRARQAAQRPGGRVIEGEYRILEK
jgi:hypothetical protein